MAYLKNDYKLMYENRDLSVSPSEISLRATKTAPALTDVNLTYKKEDGTLVNPEDFKFITEIDGNFYGSISGKPEEATVKFSVYCGDDCIYGDDVQPGPTPVTKYSLSVQTTIDNAVPVIYRESVREIEVPKGTKKTLCIYPENYFMWKTVPATCLVNGVETPITSTAVGSVISIDVTVNTDTIVNFNVGETEEIPQKDWCEISVAKSAEKTENYDIVFGFFGEQPSSTKIQKIIKVEDSFRVYVEPDYYARWKTPPTTLLVDGNPVALTQYTQSPDYYYVNLIAGGTSMSISFNTGETEDVPVKNK